MSEFADVALVGPVMSCQIDTHLQSWASMFDMRVADTALLHMQASCVPNMTWTDAILISEVQLSLAVLDKGLSISSVEPTFSRFSHHHRLALQNGVDEIYNKLHQCTNPLVDRGKSSSVSDISMADDAVFAKYGGTVWRAGLLPQNYVQDVLSHSAKFISPEYLKDCHKDILVTHQLSRKH